MKTFLLALLLALTGFEIMAQTPPGFPAPGVPGFPNNPNAPQRRVPPRFNSTVPRYPQNAPNAPTAPVSPAPNFNTPNAGALGASGRPGVNAPAEETVPAHYIDWEGIDVNQALDVYAKLVKRTVLHAQLPAAQITLHTENELTISEVIQAIQAVLALNNISVINVGDKFVKAVQSDQAGGSGAPLDFSGNSTNLPDLGTYVTRVVQLQYLKPSLVMPLLTPFAKLPNSIFPIDDNGILVIRDYAENVKRMLELIHYIDVSVPAEYISEVIPIRYAKVDDIASALNSLGGGGGSTVSIGGGTSSGQISGMHSGGISGINSGGIGGGGTGNSAFGGTSSGGITRPYGNTTTGVNGTPSGGAQTFAQRLNNIVNNASGGNNNNKDQIQLFGQTKIIPDESSSSLLIFATRQDMNEITNIIAKLDVPLAQVLIEAVIMDVSLGKTLSLGVSASQTPQSVGGSSLAGGGYNNGQSFLNTVSSLTTNSSGNLVNTIIASASTNGGSSFANSLPGGFSYFGNIGPNWDVAVNAAESDTTANVIQRPRIQTSQAQPAQFFVGETVPYVTSTYNYGGAYGNSSSYSQLSVGVELDVTPFINPDGAVAMQIQQEIDDLDGYTTITGVGQVPNTTKRTLNTTITVRDRDTVMLGGFIKTDKSHSTAGVPFLSDIPLLGVLFTQRNDAKDREELIVLMRPTVLKTPELAAQHTVMEERRLPGVSAAAMENAEDEQKLLKAERKNELKSATNGISTTDFFNPLPEAETNATPVQINVGTNAAASFQQQAQQIDARVSPAQVAKLDALLSRYFANQITTEEYQAERAKIIAGQQ